MNKLITIMRGHEWVGAGYISDDLRVICQRLVDLYDEESVHVRDLIAYQIASDPNAEFGSIDSFLGEFSWILF